MLFIKNIIGDIPPWSMIKSLIFDESPARLPIAHIAWSATPKIFYAKKLSKIGIISNFKRA